jgi:hypothetical protein
MNTYCSKGPNILTEGIGNFFNEIIAEHFQNLGKEMEIQVQELFRNPNRHDIIL